MGLLSEVKVFLKDSKNTETKLVLFITIFIALVGGSWEAYKHVADKVKPEKSESAMQTATANQGGTAINVQGNNNTVGVPPTLVEEIVTALTQRLPPSSQANDTVIKALTDAVTALSKGQGAIGTDVQIKTALDTLAQGNTAQAKILFAKAAQIADQEAKVGAEAYRSLGALSFLDNHQKGINAYRRATELDPDNFSGWYQLGDYLVLIGDQPAAIAAYQKVLALGEEHHEPMEQAAAYSQLAAVYLKDNSSKAIEYQLKALDLFKRIGFETGMSNAYEFLGYAYYSQGDLAEAIDYYKNALGIEEKQSGSKEGVAGAYANLGNLYKKRGKTADARKNYQKSLDLFKQQGIPDKVKIVQSWLNGLGK